MDRNAFRVRRVIPRLPDFFVLGAQKAGTTSLHNRLVLHPNLCLPKLKETQFFAFEEKFSLGLDWYRGQFPDCPESQVIGEVCPDYMYFPGTAERIRSCIEHPKLIFIFRHPLERAYSHYLMSVRQGFEELEFGQALEAESDRIARNWSSFIHHGYLSRGCYTDQVNRFLKVFPCAQCLFLKFEDLTNPGPVGRKTFSDLCNFLNIVPMNIDAEIRSNAASRPRSRWLRDWLYGRNRMKSALGSVLPYPTKQWISVTLDRWNQRRIDSYEMGDIPPRFVQAAVEEINQLRRLSGLDLSDWIMKDL